MPGEAGTLGTGEYAASIFSRDGTTELLTLDGTTAIEWGRVRNAYSEASVTVQASLRPECWSELGDVHTWANSLVLFRDGDRVWEGPIVTIPLSSTAVTFQARDVLAWPTRRRVRSKRVIKKDDPAESVLDEGELTLTRAMSPDDPNVLAHLRIIADPDPPTTKRDLKPNQGYHYDDLVALTGSGLNFTAVGRSIVLWTDNVVLGRTEVLVPERDTVNAVELIETGADLATRVTAAAEKEAGTYTPSDLPGGVSPFYGLHDMLTDPRGRKHTAYLETVAQRAQRRAYPAPTRVTFPQDARLDCAAPLPISTLVPGTVVPVVSDATPRRIDATFILESLKVTVGENGDETVAVTLAPAAGV